MAGRLTKPQFNSGPRNSPLPLTRQQLANHSTEMEDFKIGDRVYVGGIKPGIIAYVGEVQFSSGDWAGVVLDSPVGKNDGSVNGVRYFMCEPKRGIFSNLTKLSRYYNACLSTPSIRGTDSPDNVSDKSSQKSSSSSSKSDPKKMLKNISDRATPLTTTTISPATPNKQPLPPHSNVTNPILNPEIITNDDDILTTPNTNDEGNSNNDSLNVLNNNITSSTTSSSSIFATPNPPFGTPLSALPKRKTSVGSNSSQNSFKQQQSNEYNADHSASNVANLPFKLGDYVVVSGTKNGVVRFIGEAEFAKGVWVGVDLKEPLGKNDGSVAGKRYFHCTPLHGLFAPIHKVELNKMATTTLPTTTTTTILKSQQRQQQQHHQQQQQTLQQQLPHRYQIKNQLSNSSTNSNNLMTTSWSNNVYNNNNNNKGSQESISSIGSAASSASRRLKLGVMSLGNPMSRSKGSMFNTPTLSVLQKALKEKEEHIEQLIRERDLDRSEFIKTAAQVDEMESQVQTEKKRFEQEMEIAKNHICKLESSKADLKMQLIEERRKLEDMQFSLEEINIEKHDIQSQLDKDARRLKELDEKLKNEMNLKDKLSSELKSLKLIDVDKEDPIDEYLDQIEELTHKLCITENKLQAMEGRGLEVKSVEICKSCCKGMDLDVDNNVEKENGESHHSNNNDNNNNNDHHDDDNNVSNDNNNSNDNNDNNDHHQHRRRVLVENRKLTNQLKLLNQQKIFTESEKCELEETVKKVSAEKELIEMELNNLIEDHKKLSSERDKLAREKSSNQKLMQETGVQIKNFEQMVEKLTSDYTSKMDEMKQRSEAAEIQVQVLQLQIQQLAPYKKQVEDLTNQVRALNDERDAIIIEMQKLKSAMLDKKQNENSQYERYARSDDVVKEKDALIKGLQKEVFRLNDELKATKSPILPQVNDQEIKLLQQRIRQLEKIVQDNEYNNNNNNNNNIINNNNNDNNESNPTPTTTTTTTSTTTLINAERLKQDKEAALTQVDFLNAVIVDLQKKNTDLESKVQALESSRSMTDSALEKFLTSELHLNHHIRPFCDICDVFDQHDTEDCPKQNGGGGGGGGTGGSNASPLNASHHHGDPNEERPYCSSCEVFGHNSDLCKEEQTY